MPKDFPSWILSTRNYHLPYFGVPVTTTTSESSGKYIKVGVHNDIDKIENPSKNPSSVSQDELEEYQRAVRVAIDTSSEAWQGQKNLSDCLRFQPCMYTMTPDSFPIIDRIARNVVVGCGFSGSGFKHSPATGRMLAALALGQEDTVPEEFRADRYLLGRFQIDEL